MSSTQTAAILQPTQPRAPKRAGRVHGSRWLPYALIGPAAIYILAFQGFPLLQQALLSFSRTSLLRPTEFNFIGLDNFQSLFGSADFQNTLLITSIYVLACVAGTIGLGLGVALLLDWSFKARGLVRALVVIPWAAPPVAVALIATWILNAEYGIVNRALAGLGLEEWRRVWLDDPDTALPVILLTTIWQLFPFTAVVLLSALQAVSAELREAARVDGANAVRTFWAVTWPSILPTVALLAVLMFIWSVRRFELIWLMTQGGPAGATNTLVIDLYRRGFQFNQLGSAAAVGMVGLLVSLTVTMAYFALLRRTERAEEAR